MLANSSRKDIPAGSDLSAEKVDFQQRVEHLIRDFKEKGGQEKISLPGNIPNSQLYVKPDYIPSHQLPEVGAEFNLGEKSGGFRVNFFQNLLKEMPADYVGEVIQEKKVPEINISLPASVDGIKGTNLELSYGVNIIQAVANVYETRILHTTTIDPQLKDIIAELKDIGYTPRKGYSDAFDKIYQPINS